MSFQGVGARCCAEIATRTADYLGVKFHKEKVDEKDLASYFEDATWSSEQHYFDLSFVAKHALSKLASEVGLQVILNGNFPLVLVAMAGTGTLFS